MKKLGVKFFFPNPSVQYTWSEISAPTVDGEIRNDYEGSGNLAANRASGTRAHAGVDYVAIEGDVVLSPVTETVVSVGFADKCPHAKPNDLNYIAKCGEFNEKYHDRKVQSITIITEDGTKVKVIYVSPMSNIKKDAVVYRGMPIAQMPDMRVRHKGIPTMVRRYSEKMTNNIHMQIRLPDGSYTDRALYQVYQIKIP